MNFIIIFLATVLSFINSESGIKKDSGEVVFFLTKTVRGKSFKILPDKSGDISGKELLFADHIHAEFFIGDQLIAIDSIFLDVIFYTGNATKKKDIMETNLQGFEIDKSDQSRYFIQMKEFSKIKGTIIIYSINKIVLKTGDIIEKPKMRGGKKFTFLSGIKWTYEGLIYRIN